LLKPSSSHKKPRAELDIAAVVLFGIFEDSIPALKRKRNIAKRENKNENIFSFLG